MGIRELFGCNVFGEAAMSKLPEGVYQSLKNTSRLGKPLDPEIAEVVAKAMMEWAISQGATHYTHWFQPLNNMSAGKHDSFLEIGSGGRVIDKVRLALSQSLFFLNYFVKLH